MKTKIFIMAILPVVLLGAIAHAAEQSDIYIIKIADAISPGTAEFFKTGIKTAEDNGAACIIIELDTPGGLVEATRTIVQAIYACQVPVIVYVTPSGARAASAGVMITMAADIAVMIFRGKTGCPVIVNTSFNVRGEPIVMSPEDAYLCFMRTEMDYLVMGPFILDKKSQPPLKDDVDWRKQFALD